MEDIKTRNDLGTTKSFLTCVKIEHDMEKGIYREWVTNYPQNVQNIFELLMKHGPQHIDDTVLDFFIANGLNIDGVGKYPNDMEELTTPLLSACENRLGNVIEALFRRGVNYRIEVGIFNIVEGALLGIDIAHYNDPIDCEETLQILGRYIDLASFTIQRWVYDLIPFDQSPYLRDLKITIV